MKQVIVVRKDLNMRKGKIAAQVAHASMKVLLDKMIVSREERFSDVLVKRTLRNLEWQPIEQWLGGLFTKVVVGVDSLEELVNIEKRAALLGCPTAIITDAGLTEFKGVPTVTCVALGPDIPEKIDTVTGHLKLL